MGICLSKASKKQKNLQEEKKIEITKLSQKQEELMESRETGNQINRPVYQPQRRPLPPIPVNDLQKPANPGNHSPMPIKFYQNPQPPLQNKISFQQNPSSNLKLKPMMPLMSSIKPKPTPENKDSEKKEEPKDDDLEPSLSIQLFIFGQSQSFENIFYKFNLEEGRLDKLAREKLDAFEKAKISLLNYSGNVIKDKHTLIICGGINSSLTKISTKCFEFNYSKNEIRELASMARKRYTFPVVLHKNRLFALGGRTFGGDEK